MQTVSPEFESICAGVIRIVRFSVGVDWDGNGVFTDESDFVISLSGKRRLTDEGDEITATGTIAGCDILLRNTGYRYSRFHSGGDTAVRPYISGDIGMIGKDVRVSAGFVVDYTELGAEVIETVRVFTGVIFEYEEDSAEKTATIKCRDVGHKYLQRRLSTQVQRDIRIDNWVRYLAVTQLGILEANVDIDPSSVTLPFCWADDEIALDEIWRVASSENCTVHFDENGVLRYNRFLDWLVSGGTGSKWDFTYDDFANLSPEIDAEALCNEVEVEWSPRVIMGSQVIYELDEVKMIRAGETIQFDAQFSQPAIDVEDLANDDYLAVTAAGIDMRNYLTITVVKYAQRAHITMTNTHAATPILVPVLEIRGSPLEGMPSQMERRTASNGLPYTRTRKSQGNVYLQTARQAKALAEFLIDRHSRIVPVWRLSGVPAVPHLQLGDRVTVTDSRILSSARAGFVVGIDWRFSVDGGYTQDVRVVDAILFDGTNYFIVGTSTTSALMWY